MYYVNIEKPNGLLTFKHYNKMFIKLDIIFDLRLSSR